jgi:hypothetical protein
MAAIPASCVNALHLGFVVFVFQKVTDIFPEEFMLSKAVVLTLCATFLTYSVGCGSIMNPGPDHVHFVSQPPGATISIDGVVKGKAGSDAIEVARNATWVTYTLPGYEETKMPIAREMNPWEWGNLAFGMGLGTIVGMIIDSCTGSMQEAVGQQSAQLHRSAVSAAVP